MGHPPRRGSRVLLRLAVIPDPSVYGTATKAPSTPRRPRGRGWGHRGWLWSASKTSRWAGGPAGSQHRGWGTRGGATAERAPYQGASRGDRAGERSPPCPLKRMEERGPRPHSSPLLSFLPRTVLKGGGVLMDPKPPTDPLPPSLLCHHNLRARHLSGRLPSPRPQPASPAGSPQHSPRGRLIRGASARIGDGGSSSSSISSSRAGGGRLPRPIAARGTRTARSDCVLRAPAQVAL